MGANWQALSTLREQWQINLDALRSRDAGLADAVELVQPLSEFYFMADEHRVQLGRKVGEKIETLPNPVPPAAARDIAAKLYPTGKCTEPVMVAGLDQGWLWRHLYEFECSTPSAPGHRPPLYFLTRHAERLWLAMHLHDWSKMLADNRVRLFVGEDAVEQCSRSMNDNPYVPWAKLCVTVDPQIWPAGVSVDSLWQNAHQNANNKMQQLARQVEAMYAGMDIKAIIRGLRGEKLRVMGITSWFTTFLKYSMRDWLDAFETLGHETRMVMETAEHQITNPIFFSEAIANFKPDLILMIDHYRAEIPGLPKQIPCVMWVQDHLPHIFSPKAGKAQGRRDYCVGFGRLVLKENFGYPEQRFLPAQVGVNEARFAPRQLSADEMQTFGCEVSFVSHASAPATALLTDQLNRADSSGKKLLIDIFEQMRAVYDAGHSIPHASIIGGIIKQSLTKSRYNADENMRRTLFDFFTQKINNALFRHQSLTWAAELGLNLHIWGRGWEDHPRFAKYAKGVACNQSQLVAIYQASKINLQLTPSGAVHQRLLDGLAAGGFFLLRYCPGDLADRLHRKMWDWANQNNVATHAQFLNEADEQVRQWLREYQQLMGVGLQEFAPDIMAHLKLSADSEFARSAGTVWPEYDAINFDSREKLGLLAKKYLSDDSLRNQITRSMRQVVLERFTYSAITARLMELMADDLAEDVPVMEAAA